MVKGEIIDYTLLQKKGLLKNEVVKKRINQDNEGFVDFGKISNTNNSNPKIEENSPLSFFESISQTSNSQVQEKENSSSEITELKIKLDDAEYRIRMLEDKIRALEDIKKN